jgi:PTH1 family peptidyl-tRNA hydrolase
MNIICFLGNIGDSYKNNRHNVGFLCGNFFRNFYDFTDWKFEKKFFGEVSTGIINSVKYIFLKPSTFMNNSGKSLQSIKNFYKIDNGNICVIYDDKDLDFLKVKYRQKGSSGGQNGMKSIIQSLGSHEIQRVKIGIANNKMTCFNDTADFVLSNFSKSEILDLENIIFSEVIAVFRDNFIYEL